MKLKKWCDCGRSSEENTYLRISLEKTLVIFSLLVLEIYFIWGEGLEEEKVKEKLPRVYLKKFHSGVKQAEEKRSNQHGGELNFHPGEKISLKNTFGYQVENITFLETRRSSANLSSILSYGLKERNFFQVGLNANLHEDTNFGQKNTSWELFLASPQIKLTEWLSLSCRGGGGRSESLYPLQKGTEISVWAFEEKREGYFEVVKNDLYRSFKFYIEEDGEYDLWIELRKEGNPAPLEVYLTPDLRNAPDLLKKERFVLLPAKTLETFIYHRVVENKPLEANQSYWVVLKGTSPSSTDYFEFKLSTTIENHGSTFLPEKALYREGGGEERVGEIKENRYLNMKVVKKTSAINPNHAGEDANFSLSLNFTRAEVKVDLNYQINYQQHFYLRTRRYDKKDTLHSLETKFSCPFSHLTFNGETKLGLDFNQYLVEEEVENKERNYYRAQLRLSTENLSSHWPSLNFTYRYEGDIYRYRLVLDNVRGDFKHQFFLNGSYTWRRITFRWQQKIERRMEEYPYARDFLTKRNIVLYNFVSPSVSWETKKLFRKKVGKKNIFTFRYDLSKRVLTHSLLEQYYRAGDANEILTAGPQLTYLCLLDTPQESESKKNFKLFLQYQERVTNFLAGAHSSRNYDHFLKKTQITHRYLFFEKFNSTLQGSFNHHLNTYPDGKEKTSIECSLNEEIECVLFSPLDFSLSYQGHYLFDWDKKRQPEREKLKQIFQTALFSRLNRWIKQTKVSYQLTFDRSYSSYQEKEAKWGSEDEDLYHQFNLEVYFDLKKVLLKMKFLQSFGSEKAVHNTYSYEAKLIYPPVLKEEKK